MVVYLGGRNGEWGGVGQGVGWGGMGGGLSYLGGTTEINRARSCEIITIVRRICLFNSAEQFPPIKRENSPQIIRCINIAKTKICSTFITIESAHSCFGNVKQVKYTDFILTIAVQRFKSLMLLNSLVRENHPCCIQFSYFSQKLVLSQRVAICCLHAVLPVVTD